MPRKRIDRVRRTEKEWAGILRRLKSSGLGARQFCGHEGVALSTLQRWQQRLGSKPRTGFVELVPTSTSAPTPALWAVEVVLPNGACLRFRK